MTNLAYDSEYALKLRRQPLRNPEIAFLTVDGPTESLSDMIASTKRGIWVHRFDGVAVMDAHTLLLTGLTRDGTFLIENGKISRPIKNMRFSESPFFILNKLNAAGTPMRSNQYRACPRLKVHDFEFTSLSDAI